MSKKEFGVIVGGSGLIGGAMLHYFRRMGKHVKVKAPSSKELNLRNVENIEAYFQRIRPSFIVNASLAGIGINTQRTYDINYIGAMNLAYVAIAYDIPLIHLSSSAVLEDGRHVGEKQLRKLTPDLNDYTKSKLMCEVTLEHLKVHHNLDYTSIRLGIVYGKHDYTIQGFHRLLFVIAAGTMPVILCKKGVYHSYTNLKKIPLFLEHILENREEYRGRSINFVDPNPVEFSQVILHMRDYLQLKKPYELHMPLSVARIGLAVIDALKRIMAKIGAEVSMPHELMFLENLYTTQTLAVDELKKTSFIDSHTEQSVLTELSANIDYYVTRWHELNLIKDPQQTKMNRSIRQGEKFETNPQGLVDGIHSGKIKALNAFQRPEVRE